MKELAAFFEHPACPREKRRRCAALGQEVPLLYSLACLSVPRMPTGAQARPVFANPGFCRLRRIAQLASPETPGEPAPQPPDFERFLSLMAVTLDSILMRHETSIYSRRKRNT